MMQRMEEYGDKKDDLNGEIEIGYDGSNVFGGFISLVIYLILLVYFLLRVNRLIVNKEHEFDSRDVFYSPEEMAKQ